MRDWRAINLWRNHAMTRHQYAAMVECQGGGCAICGAPGKPLAVDHDHSTGATRSAICTRCNIGLGCFQDEPLLLRHAATYLEVM